MKEGGKETGRKEKEWSRDGRKGRGRGGKWAREGWKGREGQYNTGARDDVPGLAHFCEHMLFLGTEKFPKVVPSGLLLLPSYALSGTDVGYASCVELAQNPNIPSAALTHTERNDPNQLLTYDSKQVLTQRPTGGRAGGLSVAARRAVERVHCDGGHVLLLQPQPGCLAACARALLSVLRLPPLHRRCDRQVSPARAPSPSRARVCCWSRFLVVAVIAAAAAAAAAASHHQRQEARRVNVEDSASRIHVTKEGDGGNRELNAIESENAKNLNQVRTAKSNARDPIPGPTWAEEG
eukprot:3638672-Rhodomonas_salina.1